MMSAASRYLSRTSSGWPRLAQNLWTGELRNDPLDFRWDPALHSVRLSYTDPRDEDWEHGVVWVRHGLDRSGVFKWKAINTPRTRRMMAEHLCMVCMGSCVRSDGRIWWLFVNDPEATRDGTPITNLPPTCLDCIPESLQKCPRLVERSRVVTVAATLPYAVTGDLYVASSLDDMPSKTAHEITIPYAADYSGILPFLLGKQPWLCLLDMRDEPFVLT